MKLTDLKYGFLLGVGLLEIIGYLSGSDVLSGLGALTAASPLPLVFTDREGMEDFANQYFLSWMTRGQKKSTAQLTSQEFSRVSGPFGRKGAYATVVGYAPRLPAELVRSVLKQGFCQRHILAQALIGEPDIQSFELKLSTRTTGRADSWSYTVSCDP